MDLSETGETTVFYLKEFQYTYLDDKKENTKINLFNISL